MAGRTDFEDRRQARIDRLNDAARNAQKAANADFQRSHDAVKDIPFGQPNINGRLNGVLNRSRNAMEKSFKEQGKADFYADKVAAAVSNTAISSDDPQAIEKLQAKIARLEAEREEVKTYNKAARKNGTEPAPWYRLPYIGKDIKAAKDRIAKLQAVEAMREEIIEFDGGRIESNPNTNRIEIYFDNRPDVNQIEKLKYHGFHWSPSVGAWTRLRTPQALSAAQQVTTR